MTLPPFCANSGMRAIGTESRFFTGVPASMATGSSTNFPHAALNAQAAPQPRTIRRPGSSAIADRLPGRQRARDRLSAADGEVERLAVHSARRAQRLAHGREGLGEGYVSA